MFHALARALRKDRASAFLGLLMLFSAPQLAWSQEIVLIGEPDISSTISASYDGTLFTATGAPSSLLDGGVATLINNSSLQVSFGVDSAGTVNSALGGIDVGGTFYDIVIRGTTAFPPVGSSDLFLADVVAFDRIAGNGNTIIFTAVAQAGQFVDDGTYTVGQQVGFIANIPYGSNVWGATFTNLQGTLDVAPYQFQTVVPAPGSVWLLMIAGAALLRRRWRAAKGGSVD